MNEPYFVAETLAWCNERRKEKGKKPLDKMPKGHRGDPLSCPCGKTCELSVGRKTWSFTDDPENPDFIPLPESVRRFVEAFDEGELPQYDIEV